MDLLGAETKERIAANLANFAYDPFNYNFLRQLNVLELFLDCITEPNEKLVEFGVGGICNSCADPENAAVITNCGGIPLIIQCLSSPAVHGEQPAPSHLPIKEASPNWNPRCPNSSSREGGLGVS
ncbi:Armadillo repeat-containing protein 7 [Vitis vinifera]|uniref:Armadillo repeat-containing protein 7 n=1 Tax=Vitis vinifera TaxID=29760 RepID=A0A438DV85_VITVI|nr:Armadillo repeat-containing protein 7 [Vitis vinifera]